MEGVGISFGFSVRHLWQQPPHPPFGHLLPEGEKNWSGVCFGTAPLIPLPLGERVDRAQPETGEGDGRQGV